MKSKMLFLALASLPLGACATRPAPLTIIPAPSLVLPLECKTAPIDPVPVEEVRLPPLPVATDPTYTAIRARRAEAAGLFFQGQRDAERDARETNAATQRVCAAWARAH